MIFLTVPLALAMGVGFAGASSSLKESSSEEPLSPEESLEDALWVCILDERWFERNNESQPFDSSPAWGVLSGNFSSEGRT